MLMSVGGIALHLDFLGRIEAILIFIFVWPHQTIPHISNLSSKVAELNSEVFLHVFASKAGQKVR